MSHQQQTMERPTVSITDSMGQQSTMLMIDGQTLEQYFASSQTLSAPAQGETALIDGIPADMKEVVPAGATIVVGKMTKNG